MILDLPPNDSAGADDSAHLSPRQEGSAEAMQVLLHMADWRVPVGSAELRAITGLDAPTLQNVLKGLQLRGRVVCSARGPHGKWVLSHLAAEFGVQPQMGGVAASMTGGAR